MDTPLPKKISPKLTSPSSVDTSDTFPLKTDIQQKKEEVPFWISWRMAITIAAFFGATMHSVMRSILGMTIVCMVNKTAIMILKNDSFDKNQTTYYPEGCLPSSEIKEEYNGEFVWSQKEQSYIIGAMAWGQLILAMPAGLYADKYSAKKLLFFAVFIAAVLTFLTPFAARLGAGVMIVARICIGLTGGIIWPCINALIARWAPAGERSTLYGIITSGNQLSIVFLMPISAWFCKQKHFLDGWPVNYYLTGLLTLIWSVVWLLIAADDPSEHKRISKEELSYITAGRSTTYDKKKRKRLRLPFKEVFFSSATLAIVACLVSAAWGILLLLNYLPTYMRDVLLLDLSSNGDFSGLPFLSQFVFKILFSRLADVLKKHTSCSHKLIVKGFNTLGMWSLASFLYAATHLNCTQSEMAIAFMCIAAGLYSAVTPGFLASMVLIAPKYAGLVAAWTNFCGTFSGIILPYVVAEVVKESTAAEWRIVVGVGSIAQVVSSVIFIIWGSAEEQEWAKSLYMQYDPSSKEEKETGGGAKAKENLIQKENTTKDEMKKENNNTTTSSSKRSSSPVRDVIVSLRTPEEKVA